MHFWKNTECNKQYLCNQPLAMAMQASSTMEQSPWTPVSHIGTLASMLKHCKTCANSVPHVLVAWDQAWASGIASWQSRTQKQKPPVNIFLEFQKVASFHAPASNPMGLLRKSRDRIVPHKGVAGLRARGVQLGLPGQKNLTQSNLRQQKPHRPDLAGPRSEATEKMIRLPHSIVTISASRNPTTQGPYGANSARCRRAARARHVRSRTEASCSKVVAAGSAAICKDVARAMGPRTFSASGVHAPVVSTTMGT